MALPGAALGASGRHRPAGGGERPSVLVASHDASELRLADGRRVRLAGIHIPSRADGAEDPAPRLALEALLGSAPATLPPEPLPLDRHGRLRVQLHAAGGAWLQGELVRRGLAVVAPAPDVLAPTLAELLGLERVARRAGQGIWGRAGSGPWPAERVAAARGRYVLVRGRVRGRRPGTGISST